MSSSQMDNIKKLFDSLSIDSSKYEISMFSHPKLEDKYGEINLVKLKLNDEGSDLFVIPGYSFKSFTTMFGQLHKGMEYLSKYRNLYMINWGDTIKALSQKVSDGMSQEKAYIVNDDFRAELASLVDKLIRSPDLNLKGFTLLGKSAGGGVSIFLAGLNPDVKKLLLCCPGITNRGTPLASRPELEIHLAWNKDDDVIDFAIHDEIVKQLNEQGNRLLFHSYETGGHELNVEFLKETQ